MTDKMAVRFVVSLQCPLEEALRRLGLVPSKLWHAGELRHPKAILRHENNGFAITSESADFMEGIDEVLATMMPLQKELAKLDAKCELSVSYYLDGSERPVIHFTDEAVKQLAELRASVDVDVYYLADEPVLA